VNHDLTLGSKVESRVKNSRKYLFTRFASEDLMPVTTREKKKVTNEN